MRIQQLESESKAKADRLSKINLENSQTISLYTSQLETIESLQQHETELLSELDALKGKYENETADYEKVVSNLRQEKETLLQRTEHLSEQLAAAARREEEWDNSPKQSIIIDHQSPDDGFSDDPKTPERSAPMSPVKATPAHNAALEGQTLKASLSHAHRMVTTLRGTVHREKTEKMELRRQLSDAMNEIESLRNSKGGKKTKLTSAAHTERRTLGLGGRKPEYRISSDFEDPDADIDWETFNGATSDRFMSARESTVEETDAGFETAHDAPTSDDDNFITYKSSTDDYHTGVESAYGEGDDVDTETENSAVQLGPKYSSQADSTDDEEVMGSSLLKSRFNKRTVSRGTKRDSGDFAIPQPLFDQIGSSPYSARDVTTSTELARVETADAEMMTDPWHPERVVSVETVLADALLMSMVAIPQTEYDALVNRPVSVESLRADASALLMTVVPNDHYELLANPSRESVIDNAEKLAMVAVPKEEYNNLVNRSISAESVQEDAELLSMIAIPKEEYCAMSKRNPTLESVTADAETLSMVVVDKEEYINLFNRKITPESVLEDAAVVSMTAVPTEEYNAVVNRRPTVESVATEAAGLSLMTMAKEEYDLLVNRQISPESVIADAASISMVAIPKDEHEGLVNREITPESIIADAASISMVAIPQDAHKESTDRQITLESVAEDALSLSLVVVPQEKYNDLVSHQLTPELMAAEAASQSMVLCSQSEYESLKNRQITKESVELDAARLSLVTISTEEYDSLIHRPITVESVSVDAESLSMVAISKKEYDEMNNKIMDKESIMAGVAALSMVAIPAASYDSLMAKQSASPESVIADASSLSMTAMPKDELDSMLATARHEALANRAISAETVLKDAAQCSMVVLPEEDLSKMITASQQEALAKHEVTAESISANAASLSMMAFSKEELAKTIEAAQKEVLAKREITAESVTADAAVLSMVAVPRESYDSMTKAADLLASQSITAEREADESEATSAQRKPTVESVMSDAAELSMMAMKREEFDELVHDIEEKAVASRDISSESVAADAATLSMVVLSSDDYSSLIKREILPESVRADGKNLSMVVLTKEENDEQIAAAVQNALDSRIISLDTVSNDAKSLSMVALPIEEFERISAREVTEETLYNDAEQLSMVALTKEKLNEIIEQTEADSISNKILTPESVAMEAAALSLTVIPNNVYLSLVNRVVTTESVCKDAEAVGMVALTSTKLDEIIEQSVKSAAKSELEPTMSAERLAEIASALSMTVIPTERYEMLMKHQSQASIGSRSAISQPPSEPSVRDHRTNVAGDYGLRQASRQSSAYDTTEHQSHIENFVQSESQEDVHARIRATAIQAVTQTMIGECLWKYTRKTGRQTLSGNRHARFFWVHPYTRTLHWSKEAPSSHGGEVRAKSALIENVHVVHDDNPFPPGLFHKSIVVTTSTRVLQFTCLTQQSHDTWYLALSFLLLRNGSSAESRMLEISNTSFRNRQGSYQSPHSVGMTPSSSMSSVNGGPRSTSLMSYQGRGRNTQLIQSRGRSGHPGSTRLAPAFTIRSQGSVGRLGSLLRPPTGSHAEYHAASDSNGGNVYEASRAADSIADLRAQIEREEMEFDGLENVRACCEGEFSCFLFFLF